jgi:hypothetical protein
MNDYILAPADEFMHVPDGSVNFNESVYVNFVDPAQNIAAWMRLGNRVGEGYAELSVCIYLPDGRIACQFQRPRITDNDRFDAGGLAYGVMEPLKRVTMGYEGEVLLLDDPNALRDPAAMFDTAPRAAAHLQLHFVAKSPVHGGVPAHELIEPYYGRDFSLGHFNQHMLVSGSVRIGKQSWHIDGAGWRDHSWGPRYWQNIYFHRLFMVNFADGRGLMLLKITDPSGRARRLGVLLVDGEYEEVLDFDLITDWTERQDPSTMRLTVRTAKRSAEIRGEIALLAPLRNRRKAGTETLVSRVAEAYSRFTWDGTEGWGMSEYIERVEAGRLVGYPL